MSITSCYLRLAPQELAILRHNSNFSLVSFEEFLGCFNDGSWLVETERCYDVDRDWQIINVLMEDSTNNAAMVDREVLSKVDFGYGSAYCLLPGAVRDVLTILETVTEIEMRKRLDLSRLEALDVYPDNWLSYSDESLWTLRCKQVWMQLQGLITFLQKAASKGDAVITWLW